MKYVLDSGVAFKWVVQENGTPTALRLRESFRNSIHELIAPDCFPLEVGNALTKAERQKIINPPDGWAAWLTVMADCPALAQPLQLMPRAYAVSSQYRSALFDCLYIALAEREQCEFVTADERLLNNMRSHFSLVRSLDSMP
jgi:predicted nucleic acid-binding protein